MLIVIIQKNNDYSLSSPEHEIEQPQQKTKPRDEWVETKARADNFSPVMFVDDPSFDVLRQAQDERKKLSLPEAVQDELENEQEKASPQEEPQQDIDNTIEIPKEKSIDLEHVQVSNTITTEPKTKRTPRKKRSRIPRKTTEQSHAKPPLTLAQLTQGFLNHLKDEGNHAIHMLGKKNGRPSDEQIKYERYLEKLGWCLQNSFNIHNNRMPLSAHNDDMVHVLLSLNQDGSLKHCHISKTSGNRDLDSFTLFIFNDASSSFPPVPNYLPHNPFTINYVILVNATQESRFKLYRQ
jgi:hypothetical protein